MVALATGGILRLAVVPGQALAGIPVNGIVTACAGVPAVTVTVILTHVVVLQVPSALTK
ncbi:MAG: hypothetical protein R2847_11730 [Bacteroidia bacterium]